MVGILGTLRFRVSENRVLTFNNLSRQVSATWNSMERYGNKPLTEFGGPKLQTVSLEILLDAGLGVKPRKLLNTIEDMIESGEVNLLVIGNQIVGKNRWVIVQSSEAWETVLSKGELLRAKVSLNLQEYV